MRKQRQINDDAAEDHESSSSPSPSPPQRTPLRRLRSHREYHYKPLTPPSSPEVAQNQRTAAELNTTPTLRLRSQLPDQSGDRPYNFRESTIAASLASHRRNELAQHVKREKEEKKGKRLMAMLEKSAKQIANTKTDISAISSKTASSQTDLQCISGSTCSCDQCKCSPMLATTLGANSISHEKQMSTANQQQQDERAKQLATELEFNNTTDLKHTYSYKIILTLIVLFIFFVIVCTPAYYDDLYESCLCRFCSVCSNNSLESSSKV